MDEGNIDMLCRLCLERSNFYSNIFVILPTDSDPIYESINYVYDLQISVDDGLPQYVCQQCLSMAQVFEKYKKNVQKAALELIRLKRKMYDDPVDVKEANNSCIPSAEVRENNGSQVFVKEEVEEECTEVECSVSSSEERDDVAESEVWGGPVLLKEELGVYPSENQVMQMELHLGKGTNTSNTLTSEQSYPGGLISDDFNAGASVSKERHTNNSLGKRSFEEELTPKKRRKRGSFEAKTIYCEECRREYLTTFNYQAHHEISLDKETFECDVCEKSLPSNRLLFFYTDSESETRKYVCKGCADWFGESEADVKFYVDPNNWPCQHCGEIFRSRNGLFKHLPSHDGSVEWFCGVCGLRSMSWAESFSHKATHKSSGNYKCGHCGMVFKKKRSLLRHVLYNSRAINCLVCGKCLPHGECLKLHMATHAAKKTNRCDVCGRNLKSMGFLSFHLLTHYKRPLKCELCGFAPYQPYDLMIHNRTHVDGV